MQVKLVQVEMNQISKILSLMREYYRYDGLKFSKPNAQRAITELLKHKELGVVWFVQADEEIIGYVILAYCFCVELKGKVAIVDELFLVEEFRGRGIGLKVLSMVKQFCRKRKVKVMRLEVEYTNRRAKGAYEKFGFQTHERFLMSYGV